MTESRQHLTWSVETVGGKCPGCGGDTVLIVALPTWVMAEESPAETEVEDYERDVEIGEEVTGHYCLSCSRLTSLSLNQLVAARDQADGGDAES